MCTDNSLLMLPTTYPNYEINIEHSVYEFLSIDFNFSSKSGKMIVLLLAVHKIFSVVEIIKIVV